MRLIKPLDRSVYEKIAAGEVIDRPSAVVRELLDNSFDANSRNIKINFTDGGLKEISVSDDGDGIFYEDLENACLKHYTSKISDFNDIFKTITMGFRGEALSSISSISRMRITSFNELDEFGGELIIEGGDISSISPFARKKGTSVYVNDLFYNVPARLKFSKSVTGESRAVKDIVVTKCLPFNQIAVSLSSNGKVLFDLKSQDLINRIDTFFNSTIDINNLVEIKSCQSEQGITVEGFIGNPSINYHNRSMQYFYVNNRPVLFPPFYYVLSSIYEGLIPGSRFPIAFLFIKIPPDIIDVNIHPAKKEIKFISQKYILSVIKKSIVDAFSKGYSVINKSTELEKTEFISNCKENINSEITDNENKPLINNFIFKSNIVDAEQIFNSLSQENKYLTKTESIDSRNRKILGIIFSRYVVVESYEELLIIDYHAAHERVNYEKIKENIFKTGYSLSQKLLAPINIDLSPDDALLLSENIDFFNEIGYEIDEFGDNSFVLNSIPAIKTFGDDEDVFKNVLKVIKKGLTPDVFTLVDELIKIEACRMSIKTGDTLTPIQLRGLINELFCNNYPLTCPHGRPILIKLTKSELDKKFLR